MTHPCILIFHFHFFRCNEIVKDLIAKGGSKFEDPEFGPNDQDPSGVSSMYFYDNTVISGKYI